MPQMVSDKQQSYNQFFLFNKQIGMNIITQNMIFRQVISLSRIEFLVILFILIAYDFFKYILIIYHKEILMGKNYSRIQRGYRVQTYPAFNEQHLKGRQPESFRPASQTKEIDCSNKKSTPEASKFYCQQGMKDSDLSNTMKDRKLINCLGNAQNYPYTSVGLIISHIDRQQVYGSGTIIGKYYVLTCAHLCYSIEKKKVIEEMTFFPAYSFGNVEKGIKPKKIHISPQFIHSLGDQFSLEYSIANDFALLQFDSSINLEQSFGSLGVDFSTDFIEGQKQMIGYTKKGQKSARLNYFQGDCRLERGVIKYNMPVKYGMSGSPIIQKRLDSYYLIGIHIYNLEGRDGIHMGGLKMNKYILANLTSFVQIKEECLELKQERLQMEDIQFIKTHNWSNLAILTLVKCNLTALSMEILKHGSNKNLIKLDLGGNHIGSQGVRHLSQGDYYYLKFLSLWGNAICKDGAQFLTKSMLPYLKDLNLYHNDLCNIGLKHLCEGKWPQLQTVHLGNNQITYEGVSHLENTIWSNLLNLNLWGNKINEENTLMKSHFQRSFKHLKHLTI